MTPTPPKGLETMIERILEEADLLTDVTTDVRAEIIGKLTKDLHARLGIVLAIVFSKKQLESIFSSPQPLAAALAINPNIQPKLEHAVTSYIQHLMSVMNNSRAAVQIKRRKE